MDLQRSAGIAVGVIRSDHLDIVERVRPSTAWHRGEVPTPDFDVRSVPAAQQAWREAPSGDLTLLLGDHRAEFIGPWRMRAPRPAFFAATGMQGWWGKAFHEPHADHVERPDELHGANLVRRRRGLVRSMELVATFEDSEIDDRPALVVRYRHTDRWPWRGVSDHFRPVGDGLLLGLTLGIPMTPRGGAPFLFHRSPSTAGSHPS
ncbi:hypothetical protein KLP28_06510 [Nocardioidaceae bacterium]|nr:hypothetical protein KLP28_06510 [Nocardioidaceae bacterium]